MKLVRHFNSGTVNLGVLTDKGIIDIDGYLLERGKKPFGTSNITLEEAEVIKQFATMLASNNYYLLNEISCQFASCVSNPQKIICIGLNYRHHAIESGMAIPTIPIVFSKFNNTLCNYGEDITLSEVGKEFDYEVELGVVIGKRCKNVKAANALEYVLGYCVANDLSCRDLQFRSSQWLMGKSLDKFSPLGKYIVTKDEIPNPQNLQMNCYVNGEQRQNSNTADMVFSVAEIIEDLSKHFTLEPGDLILTGTPEGVIFGMKEKNWLKSGDVVKVEIEGLGFTENRMA